MPATSRLEAANLAHDYLAAVEQPDLALSSLMDEIRRSSHPEPVTPITAERIAFGIYRLVRLSGRMHVRIGTVILEHGNSVNTAATELESPFRWIVTYTYGEQGGAYPTLEAAVDAVNARVVS